MTGRSLFVFVFTTIPVANVIKCYKAIVYCFLAFNKISSSIFCEVASIYFILQTICNNDLLDIFLKQYSVRHQPHLQRKHSVFVLCCFVLCHSFGCMAEWLSPHRCLNGAVVLTDVVDDTRDA